MDRVVIKDYYHVIIINEKVYWMKPTHLLSSFFLNLRHLLYIYMYFKILVAF